jgi:hypothetical protein
VGAGYAFVFLVNQQKHGDSFIGLVKRNILDLV